MARERSDEEMENEREARAAMAGDEDDAGAIFEDGVAHLPPEERRAARRERAALRRAVEEAEAAARRWASEADRAVP